MFTNPYSGKFDLMQGVQQILPMLLQYAMWQELQKKDGGEKNALGQLAGVGMASPESMGGIAGGGLPTPTAMPPARGMGGMPSQAPSAMQGQPFSPGASQGVPMGADMSRINQMLKMKQMMGTDQQQMPPQMPQQQGGNLMQLLPLLMSLL